MTNAKTVLVSLDIGRGWRSRTADRNSRRRLGAMAAALMRSSILPHFEAMELPLTVFLGDLAWGHSELVDVLMDAPGVSLGARLFPNDDRAVPDDRDEEIAYLAALMRQVTGRRGLFFRTNTEELDAELGPSLLRHGFVADFSATEGPDARGRTWPRGAWHASERDDLTVPGLGTLIEVPVSADLPLRADNADAAPRPIAPLHYEHAAHFLDAINAREEQGAEEEREDGGAPLALHLTVTLEDLLAPATRKTRFDRLVMSTKILRREDWGGTTPGALVGGIASRRTETNDDSVLSAKEYADAQERFIERGGRIDAAALDPAAGWPLDEALQESPAPTWFEVAAGDDRRALAALARLIAPGRGYRLARVLQNRDDNRAALVVAPCRPHSSHAPAVRDMVARAGREASARPALSFCIISNGAKPALLERVLASIRLQEIPEVDVMVVGRISAPLPAGVCHLEAEADADAGRLGAMRNRAAAEAQHDLLVVLDDDIVLSPGWYRALCAHLGQGHRAVDVLTSRVLLPEGGRYWDHATVGGPRGHAMLEPSEGDDFAYMTGGGAWLMSRAVFERVSWCSERAFYEGEDVDFARRVQAAGFCIAHEPAMIAFHDDPKYTNVGRTVTSRTQRPGPEWVLDELENLDAAAIFEMVESFNRQSQTAEAADAIRYLALREPDNRRAVIGWQLIERRRGGPLRGVTFEPTGCPLYRRTLAACEANTPAGGRS